MSRYKEEYQGVLYDAKSKEDWDKKVRAIQNNEVIGDTHMGDFHARNLRALEQGSDEKSIDERRKQERLAVADGPGFIRGFISGLTNDEALGVQYLFERRFPEYAKSGGVADDIYFYRKDDEGNTVLSYMDPVTNTIKDEFADVDLGIGDIRADKFFGWVGPLFSFATESIGGVAGMTGGAILGSPGGALGQVGLASPGGAIGSAGGRVLGDGVRLAASLMLNGPLLNRDKFEEDLKAAGLFGAIPIGAGFTSPIKSALKTVNAKFIGEDGKTALKTILTEGGEDVDKIVKIAKDKFDIKITRAEAQGIKTNSGQIQRYLGQQPTSQRLFDFYEDRALRMEDALDNFFDEIRRGKYFNKKQRAEFKKLDELGEGSAYDDLLDAYDSALKKMLDERKIRSDKMYKQAFRSADEAEIKFDLSALKDEIESAIKNPDIGKLRTAVYKKIDSILKIADDAKVDPKDVGYKDNLRSLDEAIKDLGALYETYSPGGTKKNKRLSSIVGDIKGRITNQLSSASPAYARARTVWSEDMGHLQLFERGFLKQIANAVKTVNSESGARAIQNMFTGKASAAEIKRLKDLLLKEDPRVWQNLKSNWLRTQLSKAIESTVSPFGVPNKFLSTIGIRNPKKAFGRGAEKQRSKKINAFKAILEPQEFQNFKEITELAQAVSYIATQSTSATQPLQALSAFIQKEANPTGVVASAIRSAIELPQRLVVRGFDDIAIRQSAKQKEAYEDVLITALIDGKAASKLAESLRSINPYVQFITNSVARGVEDFSDMDPSDLVPARTDSQGFPIRKDEAPANIELRRRLEQLENIKDPTETPRPMNYQFMPQTSADVDLFEDLPIQASPSGINPALSPTLLPSEEDREIAMRMQQPGIAGLVV